MLQRPVHSFMCSIKDFCDLSERCFWGCSGETLSGEGGSSGGWRKPCPLEADTCAQLPFAVFTVEAGNSTCKPSEKLLGRRY